MSNLGYHTGQDFPAAMGTPLYALADGIVRTGKFGAGYGNETDLYLPDGSIFIYAHQSALVAGFTDGMPVKVGDIIGYVGSTGHSTGPHLHLELRPNGGDASTATDPLVWLRSKGINVPQSQ